MALKGKVALVTGSTSGIGLGIARALAAEGADIMLNGFGKADEIEALRAGLVTEFSVKVAYDGADLSTAAGCAELVAKTQSTLGSLDILVNNAGMSTEEIGTDTTLTVSDANLRKTFDTNFFAVVAVTNALLPLLRKSEAGRIVNVSSILGSLTLHATPGSPIYERKMFAYDASKTALNAYTVHLAVSLRDTKIKVNSAHPGWVKTDLGTSAAMLEVADGAKTEVQLATLGEDGPSGGYFHLGETLPW